ncbi:MAG: glutathione S-transferase N-terminal domain-containing protein [Paracoccaceae bacterium]
MPLFNSQYELRLIYSRIGGTISVKLYQFDLAPSSNRVAIFLKETGINVPTIQLNVRDGEQFKEPYNSLNPFHCVPFLELGNGVVISESLAICRYLGGK